MLNANNLGILFFFLLIAGLITHRVLYLFYLLVQSFISKPLKINYFHFDEINQGIEERITCAYTFNFDTGELKYAGARFQRRTKVYLQNIIDKLDPLSLEFLEKKENLEKEMNNQKTWRRKFAIMIAIKELQENPLVDFIDIGKFSCENPGNTDKLTYDEYRKLEQFMLGKLRECEIYSK